MRSRASTAPSLVIAVGVCVYQLSFFAAVKLTGVAVGTVCRDSLRARRRRRLRAASVQRRDGSPRAAGRSRRSVPPPASRCSRRGRPHGRPGGHLAGRSPPDSLRPRTQSSPAAPRRGGRPEVRHGGGLRRRRRPCSSPSSRSPARASWPRPAGLGLTAVPGAIPTAPSLCIFARGLAGSPSGETATIPRRTESPRRRRRRPSPSASGPGRRRDRGQRFVLAGLAVLAARRAAPGHHRSRPSRSSHEGPRAAAARLDRRPATPPRYRAHPRQQTSGPGGGSSSVSSSRPMTYSRHTLRAAPRRLSGRSRPSSPTGAHISPTFSPRGPRSATSRCQAHPGAGGRAPRAEARARRPAAGGRCPLRRARPRPPRRPPADVPGTRSPPATIASTGARRRRGRAAVTGRTPPSAPSSTSSSAGPPGLDARAPRPGAPRAGRGP